MNLFVNVKNGKTYTLTQYVRLKLNSEWVTAIEYTPEFGDTGGQHFVRLPEDFFRYFVPIACWELATDEQREKMIPIEYVNSVKEPTSSSRIWTEEEIRDLVAKNAQVNPCS